MQDRTDSNKKGFILLELIVVLLLVTVIFGISTVFFANMLPSNRLNATVRNFSSAIRQARSMAQIQGESKTVTINLDSRTYGIEGYGTKDIPSGISIKIIDPLLGELREGTYRFFVNTTGGVEGGTIVLWNSKKTISIQADPVVGAVVIR